MQNKISAKLNATDAAAFMEMCHIIKLRLIEAVFTFSKLPEGGRPAGMKTFWPDFEREFKEEKRARYMADPAQISRCEEVITKWLPSYVPALAAQELRQFCLIAAFPKKHGSIRDLCKKNKESRRIYDRRLNGHIQALARSVCKRDNSLRLPNFALVVPMLRNQTIEIDKMATVVGWMAKGAMPVINFHERNGESAAP